MKQNRYRQVLENHQFRQLWLAVVFARIAEAIASIALPLYVYDITGSAQMMGVIFILQMLPRALLAPFAGVIVDRFDRRRIMVGASLLRAVGVAFLAVSQEPWQVGLIAAVIGLGSTLLVPAELATLPEIVPADELVPALSAIQVTGSITRIAAPAVAAGIIALSGVRPAFALQFACLLISAFWFYRLRVPQQDIEPLPGLKNLLADMADGFRTVWRSPVVRGVCATEGLWSLCFAVLGISAVIYVQETLDLGDRAKLTYGLLAAMMSTGAVIGALLASRIEQQIGRPRMMIVGYLGPLLMISAWFQPPLPVLFGAWLLFGFADALAVIAMQAYLAEAVDPSMRGRVYAIWSGVVGASALAAYALAGWMTDAFGAPAALAIAGLVVGVSGPLILLLTVPRDQTLPILSDSTPATSGVGYNAGSVADK